MKLLLTACTLFSIADACYAGEPGAACVLRKNAAHKYAAKTTTADAAEDDYDIKHLNFHLNVTDTSIYMEGDVRTTAVVTAASMSEYVFELGSTLTIDSAFVDGTMLPVTGTGPVRRIALPAAMTTGTSFTARICYHGSAPVGSGFFNGVTHSISSGGTHMVYTVSDPWVALNWWPCKQSVLDKVDSVDMFVKVPTGVVDGSNGVLVHVDNTTWPGYDEYHWKTHYPIDYYLISIAVAKYSVYENYWHFTDVPTDSVLVQNFFMDTASFNPAYKANFDSLGQIIDFFSHTYGRYPFWHEKYGVCYTTLSGGMEHQTMTTIGVTNTTTIAHELAHQWFGDHVTYKIWGDMWLSEGFATFSEQLFLDHFWGAAPARSLRQSYLTMALSKPCGKTFVDDTTTSDSLFTTNQYQRAATIINTLRYMAPEDSLFFKILRTYQNTYGFGNAGTSEFKAIAESIYGFSLDTFFNQWIYGRGYPVYKCTWNQVGSTVWVKLMQSQSCPSATAHFSTPVEVHLRAGTIDTFIKVYNSTDTQEFSFEWPLTVTNVYLNTNIWTLMKMNGAITKDTHLGVGTIEKHGYRVHPNPSGSYWEVDELPKATALSLLDMTGRVLWKGNSTQGGTKVPGSGLAPGNYMLLIGNEQPEPVMLTRN